MSVCVECVYGGEGEGEYCAAPLPCQPICQQTELRDFVAKTQGKRELGDQSRLTYTYLHKHCQLSIHIHFQVHIWGHIVCQSCAHSRTQEGERNRTKTFICHGAITGLISSNVWQSLIKSCGKVTVNKWLWGQHSSNWNVGEHAKFKIVCQYSEHGSSMGLRRTWEVWHFSTLPSGLKGRSEPRSCYFLSGAGNTCCWRLIQDTHTQSTHYEHNYI